MNKNTQFRYCLHNMFLLPTFVSPDSVSLACLCEWQRCGPCPYRKKPPNTHLPNDKHRWYLVATGDTVDQIKVTFPVGLAPHIEKTIPTLKTANLRCVWQSPVNHLRFLAKKKPRNQDSWHCLILASTGAGFCLSISWLGIPSTKAPNSNHPPSEDLRDKFKGQKHKRITRNDL